MRSAFRQTSRPTSPARASLLGGGARRGGGGGDATGRAGRAHRCGAHSGRRAAQPRQRDPGLAVHPAETLALPSLREAERRNPVLWRSGLLRYARNDDLPGDYRPSKTLACVAIWASIGAVVTGAVRARSTTRRNWAMRASWARPHLSTTALGSPSSIGRA